MDIYYAFDIYMIASELENAANLLRCFYEFWDNEGNSDTEGLSEENKALIFLKRMPQYISTVYAAIDMIDSQKRIWTALRIKWCYQMKKQISKHEKRVVCAYR